MFQSRTLWHGWKYLYLVSMRLGDIIDICPVFCLLEFQKRIHSEFWRSFWEGKCFFFQLFAWQNRINSKRNELRMRQGLGLACWLLVLVIIGVIKWKHGLIFVFPPFFFSIVDMVFFFLTWFMPWLLYQTHSSSISGFCCFQQAHEGEFPWKGLGCFEIFCSQSLLQELNKLQQAREAEVLSWWNSAKFWWFSNVFKLEIRPYAVHSTNPTSGSQAGSMSGPPQRRRGEPSQSSGSVKIGAYARCPFSTRIPPFGSLQWTDPEELMFFPLKFIKVMHQLVQ